EQIAGRITLSVDGLSLYPGSSLITTSVQQLQASYDLSGSGSLQITAGLLNLQIGTSFGIQAQNVSIDPNGSPIATIGTAYIQIPGLSGLGALQLQNVALYSDRVVLGSATLKQADGVTATFGSFLSLAGVSIQLNNFVVGFGSGTQVQGTLQFAADRIAL